MRCYRASRALGLLAHALGSLAATMTLALGGTSRLAAQTCCCPPKTGCCCLAPPNGASGYGIPAYGPGKGGGEMSNAPPGSAFGEQIAAAPSLNLGEAAPAQTGQTFALATPNFSGDFFGGASGGGGTFVIDQLLVQSSNIPGPSPTLQQSVFEAHRSDGNSFRMVVDPGTNQVLSVKTGVPSGFAVNSGFVIPQSGTFTTHIAPNNSFNDGAQYQADAAAAFQGRDGSGGTTLFNSTGSIATIRDLSGAGTISDVQYAYDYVVALNVPTPGTGGLVGIQKLVENSSPIPRDRILFNYSYFNNVRFTNAGIDVNRYVVGFEKTFFDQMCSIEVRAPFAATMSPDQVAGQAAATSTQFGNLTVYGKALLAAGPSYAIGAGLGVAAPTASNINVRDIDGASLVQIQNQAVQLLPYLGAIYAPSPNWYSQGILQVSTPTSGNATLLNQGSGLTRVGAINDPTWLFASINAGYWVYRTAPTERLSGISPFVELHYNKTLNNADLISAGNFRIGNSASNIEMINGVVGANLEFFGRSYLSVAYVAPLTNGADRFFDGELRVLMNRFWW